MAILSTAGICSAAFAQSGGGYDLTWNSIDAGGQTSTGGGYTIQGVLGQPDAVVASGGGYTLQGGFLPAFDVVQSAARVWFLYE